MLKNCRKRLICPHQHKKITRNTKKHEKDMKAKTNKCETCEIKKDNKKFMRSMKNELKKKVMNEKHMR